MEKQSVELPKFSPFKNLLILLVSTLFFRYDNFHMEHLVVARKGPEYSSRGTPMKDHYFPIFFFSQKILAFVARPCSPIIIDEFSLDLRKRISRDISHLIMLSYISLNLIYNYNVRECLFR